MQIKKYKQDELMKMTLAMILKKRKVFHNNYDNFFKKFS